jgi:tetratricopeptide (TPR) repeat protein
MKRLFAVIVLTVTLPVAAQYSVLMEKGDGADLRGKTKQAANRFDAAAKVATTPEERVAALLRLADAIRGARPNAALPAEDAEAIQKAYTAAITEATDAASFKAYNDFGVFQLDRGDAAAALTTFVHGEKDLESVPFPTRARYLTNLALARMANRQPEEALAAYRQALDNDPSLTVAAAASFSIITTFDAPRGAREAASLVELLLEKKAYEATAKYLRASIDNQAWLGESEPMDRLLRCFLPWAVRSGVPFERLRDEWLEPLRRRAVADPRAAELVHIFDGTEFAADFSKDQAGGFFSLWTTSDERRDLSLLLTSSAEVALNGNAPKRAATRYFVAWQLDKGNLDVLTTLTELLNNWKDPDDPAILDRFLQVLYDLKLDAAGSGDATALLRLNLALGGVFESRQAWGPPETPRTAAYHFLSALRAYDELRSTSAKTPLHPGLRAHLANAYEHLGQKAEAWQQYVAAAEENLRVGNMSAAVVMIEKADALGYQTAVADALRVGVVRSAIAANLKANEAQSSDVQIAEVVKQRLSAHPELDARKIEVDVKQGVVTLTGDLTHGRDAAQAADVAKSAEGVKEIRFSPPQF